MKQVKNWNLLKMVIFWKQVIKQRFVKRRDMWRMCGYRCECVVWVWITWSLPEIILWLTFPVPTTHAGPAPRGWTWSFSSGSLPTSHGFAAKLGWENMPPTPVLRLFLGGGFLGNLYFFIILLCTFWNFFAKNMRYFYNKKSTIVFWKKRHG